MYPLLEAAAPLLREQHSLITRRQAVRLTNSEATVKHLLRVGAWETVDHGLYGPTGVPMTWRRRVMAAVLLGPPGSLASHRTAAVLHGVGGLDEPTPEITVPRGYRVSRPWLIAHQSLDLHVADITEIDRIPTTGPCRLAMDLGGTISPARYRHSIRELRHRHSVDDRDLLRTYLRHKRQGRTGGGALRDWLDRYYGVVGVPESGAELVVLDAILDAGLPRPILQHSVEVDGSVYRLDLAYPDLLLAGEVDGAQHHDDADIVVNDRVRENKLRAAGWQIVRVRAQRLATDLPAFLRNLERILVQGCEKDSLDSGRGGG